MLILNVFVIFQVFDVKLKREGGAKPPPRPTIDPSDQGGLGSPLSFQFYIEILTYGHVDGHAKRSKVNIFDPTYGKSSKGPDLIVFSLL